MLRISLGSGKQVDRRPSRVDFAGEQRRSQPVGAEAPATPRDRLGDLAPAIPTAARRAACTVSFFR